MPSTFANEAVQRSVTILENSRIARDTFRLRLEAPEMARKIRPGQFVMVRPGLAMDPLLGRPFALYDVVRNSSDEAFAIDVVYLVVGRGTQALSQRTPGEKISIWGPLGNGFQEPVEGPLAFVAGGIGQTPFLALARWWSGQAEYAGIRFPETKSQRIRLYYGVRSSELLAGMDDFCETGIEIQIATDDGSVGHHGYVTPLFMADLRRGRRPSRTIGCGPQPMLSSLAKLAIAEGLDCDLSLENHMACGFGACFSCVTPILQDDGSSDLRRVCVDGPIFQARRVVIP